MVVFIGIFGIVLFLFLHTKGKYYGNTTTMKPPSTRREEDRVVYAGVPPPGWNLQIPRQADDSLEPLIDPPIAVKDPYGWLRDESRSKAEVLNHLRLENEYTTSQTRHLEPLIETLYSEMVSYLQETSHSFPSPRKEYYYYRRTIADLPYRLHCRAPKPPISSSYRNNMKGLLMYLRKHISEWNGSPDTPILPDEEVYINENDLAQNYDHFDIGSLQISPSEQFVAYTVDTTGNEQYHLFIQRIEDQNIVYKSDSLIIGATILWGNDDDTLFYLKLDDSQRTYQVYKRNLDLTKMTNNDETKNTSDEDEEILLYEELDVLYWVGIEKTTDDKYLLIVAEASESTETRYIDLIEPVHDVKILSKRRPDVIYEVDHLRGTWWILSNVGGSPYIELWTTNVGIESDNWTRVMDPSSGKPILDGIPIESLKVFQNHIVIEGREGGNKELWLLQIDMQSAKVVKCDQIRFDGEPAHTVSLSPSLQEHDTSSIVVEYESLITPLQYIHVSLEEPQSTEERVLLLETNTPGYEKNSYACDRIQVKSRDGHTNIPVSLVYLQSTMDRAESQKSNVPIHLYAYGAYGVSIDSSFRFTRLPLLERGVIFAIAHVRGGGELGRPWYEDGKFLKKQHTFEDFVDVARYFVNEKQWTTPDLLSCEGRSAGGLTIGACKIRFFTSMFLVFGTSLLVLCSHAFYAGDKNVLLNSLMQQSTNLLNFSKQPYWESHLLMLSVQ